MTITRPLLAAKFSDPRDPTVELVNLTYPLFGSPKIDGIRCLVHPELGPVSRSFKPIPNNYIRTRLKSWLNYMDGELVVGEPTEGDIFNKTTSAVMSQGGEPKFTYLVFDMFDQPAASYAMRLQFLQDTLRTLSHPNVRLHESKILMNPPEVLAYEQECLQKGYEGICLRLAQGVYKSGRSTLKQQTLIKLKRVEDDEAVIIGFEQLERNLNPKVADAFGLAKRSSHQGAKVPDDLLGRLLVRHRTFGDFSVGSGFDVETRTRIWQNQNSYLGRSITFSYQKVGIVDKPRFPIFKGFRED